MRAVVRTMRTYLLILASPLLLSLLAGGVTAHPLGNFTINHFSRIEAKRDRLHLRYVIDMAEISTLQELQAAGASDSNAPTTAELDAYLDRVATAYKDGLVLTADGTRLDLECKSKKLSMPDGAGGLKTLRTELDYEAFLPMGIGAAARSIAFEDRNHDKRIGWREMVVVADSGLSIFNSSAYGSAVTDELKAYPQDALAAPLDERKAEFGLIAGPVPAGARLLQARDGAKVVQTRDRLAELISAPSITPLAALLGLLIAAVLGSMHAMSPGHGKTVVGAYLVGSRGTAKHATFLGLTVTITHTAGVFALGVVTLVASKYVLPEKLFPALSFLSGALVVGIGLSLFTKRARAVWIERRRFATSSAQAHLHADHHAESHLQHSHSHGDHSHGHHAHGDHAHANDHDHAHDHHHDDHVHEHHHDDHVQEHHHDDHVHEHSHEANHNHSHSGSHLHSQSHHAEHVHEAGPVHDHGARHTHTHDNSSIEAHSHSEEDHDHDHLHTDGHAHVHSHGGRAHSHLPPGAGGQPISWRSLLALGISGGLLPCPSALVVLLAAISLHRVGYGLLLVLAFSAGLAGSLTAVGLLFVYAGKLMKAKSAGRMAILGRIVPVFSSLVITLAGTAICVEALGQAGIHLGTVIASAVSSGLGQTSSVAGVASVAVVGVLLSGGAYWLKSHRRRHEW